MNDYTDMLETDPDTTVVFGETAFTQFETLLFELKPTRILLCTGRCSIQRHDGLKLFCRSLDYLGIDWDRFSEIEPEPTVATVMKLADRIKEFQPEMVAAMGGGSIMDAAKAAYLLAQAGGTLDDYWGVNRWSDAHPDARLKTVVCFPTTAGTGSEVTPYSNIVDEARNVKKLIAETRIIPEYSFVAPELTLSAPEPVVRATGCDALAHLIEGFLNVNRDSAHPEANVWAKEGIRLVVENLPLRLTRPNDPAPATAMAAAATLGGMVIRYKPTGLPHLCSFSWFGKIAHGLAVAMLLPASWRYYLANPAVAARTMELADLFGGSEPEAVIAGYRAFLTRCGVPAALKDIPELSRELMEQTARSGAENRMKLETAPCPVPLERSREILSQVLDQAWNGTF